MDLDLAIIGTREPDTFQAELAQEAAWAVSSQLGVKIRTGAADGIDSLAMKGTKPGLLNLFLPWSTYNQGKIPPLASRTVYDPKLHPLWTASVTKYHPNPKALSRGPFALHARNYGIVAGVTACLALPGPNESGGTAQGIRICRGMGIPIGVHSKGTLTATSVAAVLRKLIAFYEERTQG
jgi:hypothetical protein